MKTYTVEVKVQGYKDGDESEVVGINIHAENIDQAMAHAKLARNCLAWNRFAAEGLKRAIIIRIEQMSEYEEGRHGDVK
jgi:hypothetical protein